MERCGIEDGRARAVHEFEVRLRPDVLHEHDRRPVQQVEHNGDEEVMRHRQAPHHRVVPGLAGADLDDVDGVRRGLSSGGPIAEVAEKKILRKDGSTMSCRVKRLIIRDQSGAAKFMISRITSSNTIVAAASTWNSSRESFVQL